MRKALLIALLLLCTPAFAAWGKESALDRANGEWVCDPMASIALAPSRHGSSPSPKVAEDRFGGITIHISSKGKRLSMHQESRSETIEFTVVSDSEKTLVIKIDGATVHIVFITEDSIMVENRKKPDSKIVFNRMK